MKVKALILSFLFLFSFSSCDEDGNLNLDKLFTETDNANGLKEALKVGTRNATTKLGVENGYLKDEAVKILLPEKAQTTFKVLETITGNSTVKAALGFFNFDIVDGLQNTLEVAFNHAAETAAPEAVNVFVTTITAMTIRDATTILFSSNNEAATDYLRTNSYPGLQSAFDPIINKSMKTVSVTIGSTPYDALQAWEFFANYNNQLANIVSSPGIQDAIKLAKALGTLNTSQIATIDRKSVV